MARLRLEVTEVPLVSPIPMTIQKAQFFRSGREDFRVLRKALVHPGRSTPLPSNVNEVWRMTCRGRVHYAITRFEPIKLPIRRLTHFSPISRSSKTRSYTHYMLGFRQTIISVVGLSENIEVSIISIGKRSAPPKYPPTHYGRQHGKSLSTNDEIAWMDRQLVRS